MSKRDLSEGDFIRKKVFDSDHTLFQKYADLIIGNASVFKLIKYELITGLFGSIPGALGLFLRKKLYPFLFVKIGKNVIFGKNITIRHPENIFFGDNVIIDDYSFIDGRGAGKEGVRIGSGTLIGRHTTILSKVGPISLGKNCNLGAFSIITAQGGVEVGDWVQIAGGCKISGGLFKFYATEKNEVGFSRYTKGSIVIKERCFIGGCTLIMDGVTIGKGSMTGAGSVVVQNIPAYSIYIPKPGMFIGTTIPSSKEKQK